MYFVIILVAIFGQAVTQDSTTDTCEYSSCTEFNHRYFNVHLVPHSHNDPGWLHTAEEYYNAAVRDILDSVVKGLWKDPKRKFTYVESFYFFKWWKEQTEEVKSKVHTLVKEGRLQFAGGGWSMNDEATTNYQSIIDQFTYGLNMIKETFGDCATPRIAWQIDPFGHSREFASLLAAMGFHGQILGRIDYQDKEKRLNSDSMQFVWRGDDSLGEESDIFTGILYDMYWPPPGFCFDKTCGDDPVIDDDSGNKYGRFNNVKRMLLKLYTSLPHQRTYKSLNLLLPMGQDFHYQDSEMWFSNLDKLIRYNEEDNSTQMGYKLFYSTPQCFFRSVRNSLCRNITEWLIAQEPKRRKREALRETLQQDRISHKSRDQEFPSDEDDFYSNLRGQNFPFKRNFTFTDARGHLFSTDEYKDNSYQNDEKFPGDEDDIYSHSQKRMSPVPEDEFKMYFKSNDDKDTENDHPNSRFTEVNGSSKFPMKYDDFFPYASSKYAYWTGYYTSRPTIKYLERQANSYLQMAKQLQVLGNLEKRNLLVLDELKSAMGIMQHHEAITGTSKQYVTDDYVRILSKAVSDAGVIPQEALRKLMKSSSHGWLYASCHLINESSCPASENSDPFMVTVYNPLAWRVKEPIRIPIRYKDYVMKTYKGIEEEEIEVKLQKVPIPKGVQDIPARQSRAAYELVFIAELGPLSFSNYYVKSVGIWYGDSENEGPSTPLDFGKRRQSEDTQDNLKLKNEKGVTSELLISYGYYVGENIPSTPSGAYILHTDLVPIKLDHHFINHETGPIVDEITLVTSKNINSTFRRYHELGIMENDWIVGPIPISDNQGKEYVVFYTVDINHNNQFYTDSNGRQLLKRELDKRPQIANQVGANYYPVTNQITIQDDKKRFSVLTDRSEGGSLSSTGIEVMLHRRLLKDDGCGVEEALNEYANGVGLVVRGQHRLIISKNNKESILAEKKLVKQFNNRPQVFVSDAKRFKNKFDFRKFHTHHFSFAEELPEGLHLLTLEPWGERLLIRLENYLDISDRETTTIEIDLRNIFTTINVQSFIETTLAANRLIEDWNRLSWINFKNWFADECTKVEKREQPTGFNVEIKARQIRTFIIDYKLE